MIAVLKCLMTSEQEALLRRYAEAVANAPSHLHLTSDRDAGVFWERHVIDAVELVAAIPPHHLGKTMKALDAGSGNGIPGIPIAIQMPIWQVDLVDSDKRKCGFLESFCINSSVKNVRVVHGRLEALAHTNMRAGYDIVFARALSKLPVALELSSAFLRQGGTLIVPHGTSWRQELENSGKALESIGISFIEQKTYKAVGTEYSALLFKKNDPTPDKYPRKAGIPEKRPL